MRIGERILRSLRAQRPDTPAADPPPVPADRVFDKSLLRWYYNSSAEAPNVVSLDFGDPSTEIKLHTLICYVGCFSQFRKGASPQFWAETMGVLRIRNGTGTISKE